MLTERRPEATDAAETRTLEAQPAPPEGEPEATVPSEEVAPPIDDMAGAEEPANADEPGVAEDAPAEEPRAEDIGQPTPPVEDELAADDVGSADEAAPPQAMNAPEEAAPEMEIDAPTEPAISDEPTPEDAAPAMEIDAPTEPAISEEPAPEEAAPEQPAPPPPAPEPVAEAADDPFSGPGDWYVIHTYAGYENKVKANLGSRIQTMQMQDRIFDVVVPMEDVMEIKGGRKQVVQKKVFPGYLLVKMVYDNDSWYVVRNTPGVTGFVSSGTGQKPTPLPRREVEKFLLAKKEEAKPAFRLEFEEQDVVRIISGPFADFTGTISEINVDQSKVKVMVNIFDRETPVELGFDQVVKV